MERIPLIVGVPVQAMNYLDTKRKKFGHLLPVLLSDAGNEVCDTSEPMAESALHPLIAERRSIFTFSGRDVDMDVLVSLLEAARWAPSSFNDQPWRFVLAKRYDHPEAHKMMASCLSPHNFRWAQSAPVLLLTVAVLKSAETGSLNRHAWHDVGLAMGNLQLQATFQGLSVHQMGGFDVERARALFEIPTGCELITISAIGYEEKNSVTEIKRTNRTRMPLESLVFTQKWGSQ